MTLKLKSSSEGDFIVKRFVSSRRIRRRKRCAKRSSYAQDITKLRRAYAEHALERAGTGMERAGKCTNVPGTRPASAKRGRNALERSGTRPGAIFAYKRPFRPDLFSDEDFDFFDQISTCTPTKHP